MELKNKYVILLLTNRDSDNIGDQVIENSDIGLLHALMILDLAKVSIKLVVDRLLLLQKNI